MITDNLHDHCVIACSQVTQKKKKVLIMDQNLFNSDLTWAGFLSMNLNTSLNQ
jgi:hypothetical protein